jgi:hypothetical protein
MPAEYARVVRGLAVALTAIALVIPAAAAGTAPHQRVAFFKSGNLVVVDLASGQRSIAMRRVPGGPVRWSGDGNLLSSAGRIVAGPVLPTSQMMWAPTGETAAYQTKSGAVRVWTRSSTTTVVPANWGATSLAWGPNGALALGRSICQKPCGIPRHQEVWIWRERSLRRVAGPLLGVVRPLVVGFAPDGRVLWWPDEQGSASLAADGLSLQANDSRIATTLVFPDYVVRCGRHLAIVAGGDRFTTHKKRIVFDGRDISRDYRRSWVSPSCSATGVLIAAGGRNWEENRFGAEHRAIWQLLPARKQLTRPPAGWTDENPTLLRDGSILFVRTHQSAQKKDGEWLTTSRGKIEVLKQGKLVQVGDASFTSKDSDGFWLNYYGHYNWPWRIAVSA